MRLVVAIPTFGRKAQVARLLRYLTHQTRLPDEVIVSAPDASHVELPKSLPYPARAIFGPPGSCAQRNTALEAALNQCDAITFFDDDFVPAEGYLADLVEAFRNNPDSAVIMGHVVRDGASTAGIDWDEAIDVLARSSPRASSRVVDHIGAYGCNMSIRAEAIGDVRFDERLVLYGWQEDIDFTSRLRARGRVVCVTGLQGVHLGLKSGRVSGTRFGYSQVVNPIYLIRKGTVPASFALPLMLRNLAANLVRSFRPEAHVDRRGRLRGNFLGIAHLLIGRIEPEYALRIS